jgi:hypothetical protein
MTHVKVVVIFIALLGLVVVQDDSVASSQPVCPDGQYYCEPYCCVAPK